MHIDWVSKAGQYGSNPCVTGITIRYQTIDGETYSGKAYGPLLSKSLTRWPYSPGTWVWENADNMNDYALAKYVQSQIGNVDPNFPVVTEENISQPWKGMILAGTGTDAVQWNDTNEIFQQMVKELNNCVDDVDASASASSLSMTAMAPDSSYPASYISALVTTQTQTLVTADLTSAQAPGPTTLVPPCVLTATYVTHILLIPGSKTGACGTDQSSIVPSGDQWIPSALAWPTWLVPTPAAPQLPIALSVAGSGDRVA